VHAAWKKPTDGTWPTIDAAQHLLEALVSLGRSAQLPQQLRASLKAGLKPAELREVIMQTALIAGFPAAMNAMSTLRVRGRRGGAPPGA
jgi:Carboxymuconolactone decarboxylase family